MPFQCPSSQSDDSLHTTFGLCSCSQSSYHLWFVFNHSSNHLSLAFIESFSIPPLACVHSPSPYHFWLVFHAVILHTTSGLCSCSQSSYHLWLVFMQSVFISPLACVHAVGLHITFGLYSFNHFSNHLSLAFIVILQTTFGLCSQTISIPLLACIHSHSAYHFTLCSLSHSSCQLWLVFIESFSIPPLACVHAVILHTTFGLCS